MLKSHFVVDQIGSAVGCSYVVQGIFIVLTQVGQVEFIVRQSWSWIPIRVKGALFGYLEAFSINVNQVALFLVLVVQQLLVCKDASMYLPNGHRGDAWKYIFSVVPIRGISSKHSCLHNSVSATSLLRTPCITIDIICLTPYINLISPKSHLIDSWCCQGPVTSRITGHCDDAGPQMSWGEVRTLDQKRCQVGWKAQGVC
ncbi:hypothetical protein BJX70DRAFT_360689 [Aspergillus crustosus]